MTAVSSAIGTQRQFAKQPERVYQANLKNPSFSRGISVSADEGAALLARSLGVLGNAIMNESIAADKREQEQFTTEDAENMLFGKTPEDLKTFDAIKELQHSDKGFDLTDNPYAIAALDMSMGKMASAAAKEEWRAANTGVPKSINDAVQSYNGYLQESIKNFEGSVHNKYAFEKGYLSGYTNDVLKVAHEARERINEDARVRGQNSCNVRMQELISAAPSLDLEKFTTNFQGIAKEYQLYSKNSKEALAFIDAHLGFLVENETTTEKLNAVRDIVYFGEDRKIGDELPLFKHYKKIADNYNAKIAASLYEQYRRPDGTLDLVGAKEALDKQEGITGSQGYPSVNLKGTLTNVVPELEEAIPAIGGLISLLGYGDVACLKANNSEVSIYLGDVPPEEQQEISQAFSPYFGSFKCKRNADGVYLGLSDYKGGMKIASNTELTAFAYTPERRTEIWKQLETLHKDAKALVKQQDEDYKKNLSYEIDTATNYADKVKLIRSSKLPISTKQRLLSFVEKEANLLEDTSDMNSNEKYYLTQYRKKGDTNCAYNKDYATYYNFLEESASAGFEDPDGSKQKAFLAAKENLTRYDRALNNVYKKRRQNVPELAAEDKELKKMDTFRTELLKLQMETDLKRDDLFQAVIDKALLDKVPIEKYLQIYYNLGGEDNE